MLKMTRICIFICLIKATILRRNCQFETDDILGAGNEAGALVWPTLLVVINTIMSLQVLACMACAFTQNPCNIMLLCKTN